MTSKFVLKELSRYRIGTYADIIYRNALLYPDKEALIYGPERITFAEYNSRVNRLIHALQFMGNLKGDTIGVLSWNCLEYTYVFGAALKGGFVISPFNARLQVDELDYLLNHSGIDTLFVDPELSETVNLLRPRLLNVKNYISFEAPVPGMTFFRDLLSGYSEKEPDVMVEKDDALFIIYTSGTTGLPRGALYTQYAAMDNTRTCVITKGFQHEDKNITIMPLFHVGGIDNINACFYVGSSNVIMKTFSPAAILETIQDEKVTDIQIVATHLAAILALPDFGHYNLSSLKRIYYTGSPMPVELLRHGLQALGPVFIQGYGQTESGPNLTALPIASHKVLDKSPEEISILASCGQPDIGVHIRIVDENDDDVEPGEVGEIIARSEHNMLEYWHNTDDTNNTIIDGWLHTGDMGHYDERGYIYIVDRKKDMIVSGGENIYPREVEEVLYQHPAILEAAAIGIPDPYWVERVHAIVTLKKEATLTEKELIDFCKGKIARYKAPKTVEFVESLPKNPSGKILKKVLLRERQRGIKEK